MSFANRLNFLHWRLSTKLAAIFLLAVLLPAVLILVPFSTQRRIQFVRDQNKTRLETLGPLKIAETEQVMTNLAGSLRDLYVDRAQADYIDEFLLTIQAPDSESDLDLAWTIIERLSASYLRNDDTLSRVRFFGKEGSLILDAVRSPDDIAYAYEPQDSAQTPTDAMMPVASIGTNPRMTTIYQDAAGNPTFDIIFGVYPLTSTTGDQVPNGYVVFTHDLLAAAAGETDSGFYPVFQDYPDSDPPTRIFVLNQDGLLVTPAETVELFTDLSDSAGFLAANRGESGVTTYYSPLLDTEVLGYYANASINNGPELTFLVETSLSEIDTQSLNEALFSLLVIGGGILLFGSGAILIGNNLISRPLARLTEYANLIAAGHLNVQIPTMTRRDEIGVLNNTINNLSEQLLNAINELEGRVVQRTANLQAILEIGRTISGLRDVDILLDQVVNLIRNRFDTIYHAQVFLIDPRTNRANLRASTGAPGLILLQRGHFLEVGSQSVIGSVTASGHAVVALDTSTNPIHQRNEFLPETRAEMALPLQIGNQVIGALDLQSKIPNAFDEQDVELFQGMADQIAIALENASLFDESHARLEEIERLNRTLTQKGWRELELGRKNLVLSAGTGPHTPDIENWTDLQSKAIQTHQIVEHVQDDTVTFAVPVSLRGQILGAIEWKVPRARYTPQTRQVAQELSARLALTAENIRLFEKSRRAVQREELVNRISGQLTGTSDIDEILQTAVRELGLALQVPHTAIRLSVPADSTLTATPDPGD